MNAEQLNRTRSSETTSRHFARFVADDGEQRSRAIYAQINQAIEAKMFQAIPH